jgi:hypothetical protein
MAINDLPQGRSDKQYASTSEAHAAITDLSKDDHVKLFLIAAFFCRQRGLLRYQIEPTELLNEAVARTLNGDKRWRKDMVSIVKHLDRAMENISGHMIEKAVADGEYKEVVLAEEVDSRTSVTRDSVRANAEIQLLAREQLAEIERLFAGEPMVLSVLYAKAEGYPESEIMARLGIDKRQYEAIRKTIERAIASYIQRPGV